MVVARSANVFLVFVASTIIQLEGTNGEPVLLNDVYAPQVLRNPMIPSPNYDLDYYKSFLSYSSFLYCDYSLSGLINDPSVIAALDNISQTLNIPLPDLIQWYLLIIIEMPNLDSTYCMSMIYEIANDVQRELSRRGLNPYRDYPYFCLSNDSPYNNYQPPHTLNGYPIMDPSSSIYQRNIMQFLNRILPKLSQQLLYDLRESVYKNVSIRELGNISSLIDRFTANIRLMMSQMYKYKPVLY